MRVVLSVLALLLLSGATQAQAPAKTPEQMLPGDALFYFRYDGYERHRKAYDQTAVATAMKEGLSEFFDHVFAQIWTLGQINPLNNLLADKTKKKNPGPAPLDTDRLLDYVGKHGFALSVELAPSRPGTASARAMFQLTIVFPQGADEQNRNALEAVFRFAASALESPVADVDYNGRRLAIVSLGETQAAWWAEGKHLVFALGPQAVKRSLRVIDGRRPSVAAAPWYLRLAEFNRYETDMRGYVNLESVVERLADVGLDAPAFGNLKDHLARQLLLRHFGLTGLKDFTFHLGFDGKYQRSTLCLGVPEPGRRGGLLNLVSGSIDFAPDKLPPLPPDADYVSVRRVDWANVLDFIRGTYGMLAVSQLLDGQLPERFPDLDRIVGGDFRKDFLDQLDTNLVSYGGHSEGPFFLGQGFAVKVKDAAKVRQGLQGIAKALGEIDAQLVPERRMYRGEEMHVFSNFYLPLTYAVYKDWLVFGLFPQPVQGFVMRSGGKYRAWQAPPELHEVLAKERREGRRGKLLAVIASDPRPAVTMGLAVLPVFFHSLNVSAGTKVFDVSKIPNTQSVNEWLFPNINLFYDDGNALRWESHYSISEPDQLVLSLILSVYTAGFFELGPARLQVSPANAEKPVASSKEELKTPTMCTATASANEGVIQIRLTVSRKVSRTVYREVVAKRFKERVTASGKKEQVPYTVTEMVPETIVTQVDEQKRLVVDGKTVRVTRKDGRIVDPKELPKLLEKETQVLYVPNGEVGAEQLLNLDDRTLIITVTPTQAWVNSRQSP